MPKTSVSHEQENTRSFAPKNGAQDDKCKPDWRNSSATFQSTALTASASSRTRLHSPVWEEHCIVPRRKTLVGVPSGKVILEFAARSLLLRFFNSSLPRTHFASSTGPEVETRTRKSPLGSVAVALTPCALSCGRTLPKEMVRILSSSPLYFFTY